MSKARVLRDANHYSEALSEFEASLKRYPGDNTILWQYAVYYVVLGDYQKRSACWKNAPWARLTGSMVIAMVN